MTSNLARFKKDLDALLAKGNLLELSLQRDALGAKFIKVFKDAHGEEEGTRILNSLPDFNKIYQTWYSEALSLIRQMLPHRLSDFTHFYEKPKRTEINSENYRIEDALSGLEITRGQQRIVGMEGAIPYYRQQLAILNSVKARFESSLFDVRQLVQADLLDSELDAASELARHKFTRAAGALAGVVLEKHLTQVCENHSITISKRNPTIADFNDALKEANAIDIPQWRFVQHLGDIRNLCDHNKATEPTKEQVDDLIAGVSKIVKTTF